MNRLNKQAEKELGETFKKYWRTHQNINLITKFKQIIIEGDDCTAYIEQMFHDAFWEWLHELLTENEEMIEEILAKMKDWGTLPDTIEEFQQLGTISVILSYPMERQRI